MDPLLVALVGLVALAAVILIGRMVLKIAWRLVIVAAIAVGVVYVLGLLGISVL
jgi:hypothetical protein